MPQIENPSEPIIVLLVLSLAASFFMSGLSLLGTRCVRGAGEGVASVPALPPVTLFSRPVALLSGVGFKGKETHHWLSTPINHSAQPIMSSSHKNAHEGLVFVCGCSNTAPPGGSRPSRSEILKVTLSLSQMLNVCFSWSMRLECEVQICIAAQRDLLLDAARRSSCSQLAAGENF